MEVPARGDTTMLRLTESDLKFDLELREQRKEVQAQLDEWERHGYPLQIVQTIPGLRSFASGGEMNSHGTRSNPKAQA